jgi:hypothetical protein
MSDWRSLGWKSGRLISTPAFDRQGVGATQEAPYLPLETPDAGGGGGGLVEKTGAAAFNYTIGVNHTTNTVAITVPSDADYIGICVTATDNTAVSITSVTANSDTCTLVPDTDTGNFLKSGVNVRHSGYYRLMPDTGAINVVVTFSATLRESLVSVQCYKGVDQTTPNEGGFALTDTAGTAGTEEIAPTTTTVSGDYLMGGFLGNGNDVDMTILDEALGNGYDSNNGFDFLHAADAITGAGETLDFTHDQFQNWNGFVWVIKAAAGGSDVTVNAGVGELSLTGLSANVNNTRNVTGTLGALSLTGLGATISTPVTISTGLGALSLTGLIANIDKVVNVSASLGQLNLTGLLATVDKQTTISATLGALSLTGLTAQVDNTRNITASVGELSLTGLGATVSNAGSTNINAGIGELSLTGLQATINNTYAVSATVGQLNLTGLSSTVTNTPGGLTVTASVGDMALTGLTALIQNVGQVTQQIGGGIDHQIKRRKATLAEKPNQHLDQIIAKAFKTVFGELTDKKAPKTVQKQANKIVSEYTESYRPKYDEIDWFAFNQDLEAVQRLFALYQREVADARQIAENKRIFDIIENDNLEFLLMH